MNFNFKTFSLLCAGVALGLSSCSNDDMLDASNSSVEGSGSYVHVSAGISLPNSGGTRSATDDYPEPGNGNSNSNEANDVEQAYDYENEIRTLILVYATKENKYITHSVITGITKAPVTNAAYDYVADGEIAHATLEAAYAKGDNEEEKGVLADYDPENDDIHVFAICNYTSRVESYFEDAKTNNPGVDWLNWVGTVNEDPSPVGSHNPTIDNTIWAKRSFLMTNYEIAKVKFPGSIEEWDDYADKSHPWLLNSKGTQVDDEPSATPDPIRVERSAARFDFRDASSSRTGNSNTYDLLLHKESYGNQPDKKDGGGAALAADDDDQVDEGKGDYNIVSIKLTQMSLVNEAKNFYYLRRVADNYSSWLNPEYCGKEYMRPGTDGKWVSNFVVDSDWDDKMADEGMGVDTEWTNFNFPLYTKEKDEENNLYGYNKNGWFTDDIDDFLKGNNDNDLWDNGSGPGKYKIWRYVTENTLPSAEAQRTVQSTGIVFKGKLLPGKDITEANADQYVSDALVNALNNVATNQERPVLYSFENRLFAGPEDLIKGAAQDGENSALYAAVNKVLKNWKLKDENSKEFTLDGKGVVLTVKIANEILIEKKGDHKDYTIKDLNDQNLTSCNVPTETNIAQFKAEYDANDGWGYYCYYFYWNRHNDNQKSGLMGDMEFATVRNNVYKLAVTGINRIGHPTNPGDDPDPEKPENPDEPPTNYIRVQVEVLPWVVRVNNIEF